MVSMCGPTWPTLQSWLILSKADITDVKHHDQLSLLNCSQQREQKKYDDLQNQKKWCFKVLHFINVF